MNHEELLALLNQIDQKTIYFGPQGFELLINEDEVARAQIGYGLDENRQSLSGENAGDWQYSWLVIAKDTELGDVYFIDLNDFFNTFNLIVFTKFFMYNLFFNFLILYYFYVLSIFSYLHINSNLICDYYFFTCI